MGPCRSDTLGASTLAQASLVRVTRGTLGAFAHWAQWASVLSHTGNGRRGVGREFDLPANFPGNSSRFQTTAFATVDAQHELAQAARLIAYD